MSGFEHMHQKGLALLDVLLVVAIIAIVASIAVIAINPGKQLADTRNAQRQMLPRSSMRYISTR